VTIRLIGPGRVPEESIMRKHRSFCPTALSPLEDRVALSHAGIAPAALVQSIPQFSPSVQGHALALNGTISGTFVTTRIPGPVSNPAAGTMTTFQGSGTITGLGKVEVTGSVVTSGGALGAPSSVETFTLTTTQGSVTLELKTSPNSAATSTTVFSIVGATGAFQGDTGTGTAELQLFNALNPVAPAGVTRGDFALTLHSTPPTLPPVTI
jgi:hypothetical protein